MKIRLIIITILIFFILDDNLKATRSYYFHTPKTRRVITGLENFVSRYALKYKGKNAAVVTNNSGVDFNLQRNLTLLRNRGIEITLILAPEHGIYGYQNDYDKNMYTVDDQYNAIVYNLHKLDNKSLKHLLKLSQIVIFDIQDMGMRCYTYISSLKFVMDTVSGTDKEVIVLDRPNPIGFLGIDGACLDDRFYSKFVSSFPAPLFYNMTIGEAAKYYQNEYSKNTRLRVITMSNYRRDMMFFDTQIPWIPPSPNLPTYKSSIVYAAVVLLEGINISLGRGTAMPFEFIGAPWIEPVSFCKGLDSLGLSNFAFLPVYFEPTFSLYKRKKCGGVQIFYLGGNFSPAEAAFKIIKYIKDKYRECEWSEYKGKYSIDNLAGTDLFRKSIDNNEGYEKYQKKIKGAVEIYKKKRIGYLFYN